FQAEDGIRDLYVTGVQTCALPICLLDVEHAVELHVAARGIARGDHVDRVGAIVAVNHGHAGDRVLDRLDAEALQGGGARVGQAGLGHLGRDSGVCIPHASCIGVPVEIEAAADRQRVR